MRACAEEIKQKFGLKEKKKQFGEGGRGENMEMGDIDLEKLRQKLSSWHVGCSRAGQESLMPL